MANLGEHFKVDYVNNVSKPQTIFKGQFYRITVLSDLLVRLEFSEEGYFEDRPTEFAKFRNFPIPQMKVDQNERYLDITTKYFNLRYEKEKSFFGSKYSPDSILRIKLLDAANKEWYFGHPEARNYGGIVANLDKTIDPFVEVADVKDLKHVKRRIETMLETKIKGLYSNDGFVSIDDSKSNFLDEEGNIVFNDKKRTDIYVFMYNRDFGNCLQSYFTLTGMPPLIPRYALGIWWNKADFYYFDDVKKMLGEFNKYKIPVSVLLLGDNWHLKDKNNLARFNSGFTFNRELFPKPTEFVKYLHDRGVRLGVTLDPSEGIHPHEPKFDEVAKSIGSSDKQIIPFNVFDNDLLQSYFKNLIDPLYKTGVDFFAINYRNLTDKKTNDALNYYHFNDCLKMEGLRPMILSRANTIAPHKYPVHYSGETLVSWGTLKTLPFFNSTSSNLGLSWWSHDIGGYKDGVEDSELYARYVQYGTFSPIFRFSSKYGRYYKREPWKWDVKTQSIVRDYCQLRHRLIPYIYSEAYKYHKVGLPLIQPLYYQYPEIYDEIDYKNEYYFGSELFVAPITKHKDVVMNRSVEKIFLPKGTWYDFKTGKKYLGNKRYILFYKDEDYPVFARDGSIVCMADLEKNLNVTNSPTTMEVHVFPGKSNQYNLYEDDGFSNLHEQGYYMLTRIDYNYMSNNYTLIIRPVEGKTGIVPAKRNYRIRFRNTREASDVVVYIDNDRVETMTYVDDTDFIVEVPDVPTTKQLTINCKGKDIEIDAVRLINEDIDSIISDLQIKTLLKEQIGRIMFSNLSIERKRLEIRKMQKRGLDKVFVNMFMKLLEYVAQI
jgi:alpha-glucosidase (family GH31 glycosyl hydrolase)